MFVDFSAGYFLTKELQLKFEAQNLTDESYYVYTGRNAYNAQYREIRPDLQARPDLHPLLTRACWRVGHTAGCAI